MKQKKHLPKIQQLAIDDIHILNPRVRNQKIFQDITENISKVGLKRPITVRRADHNDNKPYDLVCGQGRLEAFMACGQTHIPAIIIDATQEDALIMSLVENLARKQHRPLELMHGIEALQQKNYDVSTIAKKTGMSDTYTRSILELLEKGEQRLLIAVENGTIPMSVAITISRAPNNEQQALQDAYENNDLRGHKLKMAKQLLEARRIYGKSSRKLTNCKPNRNGRSTEICAQDVLRVYQKEVDRKRLLARKADMVGSRMLFIVEAFKRLHAEEHFVTLLKAEGLSTMPQPLSELLEGKR